LGLLISTNYGHGLDDWSLGAADSVLWLLDPAPLRWSCARSAAAYLTLAGFRGDGGDPYIYQGCAQQHGGCGGVAAGHRRGRPVAALGSSNAALLP
jgi:hypothetical protein